ncbi:MAG: bacterial transcriptional activator domain-containing protein [Kineosporiaceae bacterium]
MDVADGLAPRVAVHLLGGFAVHLLPPPDHAHPALPLDVPIRGGGQRLLAFLGLHRRAVRRARVAAELWPEATGAQASANLRTTLRRLPRPEGVALVAADTTTVGLPAGADVDFWRARASMEDLARGGADGWARAGADDVALLAEDLLPDRDEEWLLAEQEHHRQRRLHALERIAGALLRARRTEDALAAALLAVAGDPLRESAQRRLIQVHLDQGNVAEALRQFHVYRTLLRRQLGLTPSPAIRELVAGLLGRPADRTA